MLRKNFETDSVPDDTKVEVHENIAVTKGRTLKLYRGVSTVEHFSELCVVQLRALSQKNTIVDESTIQKQAIFIIQKEKKLMKKLKNKKHTLL